MALALGKTVTELQAHMPLSEVALWQRYRKQHGPLTYERMFDRPAALLAFIFSRAHGGKATMKDLLPYSRDGVDEAPPLEDIIKQIGGTKIGKRKPR